MNKKQFKLKRFILALCVVCCCPSLLIAQQAGRENGETKSMANFQDMHHGLFFHYLYIGREQLGGRDIQEACWVDGTQVASLDELADNLDIPDLVNLCETARAQYVVFTVFHANMNALYPSKVMDKYLPGHTSKRDVVGELVRALKAKGIRIILYYHPSDAHDLSDEDQARVDVTGFVDYNGAAGRTPQTTVRWNDFVNELLGEMLERYGEYTDGIFVDGGLPKYVDAARIRKTIKSYDPNIWIIQNAGLRPDCADFSNSEEAPKAPFPVKNRMYWHIIDVDGRALKDGNVLNNPETAYRYTVMSAAVSDRTGGGTSWAFGPYPGGNWPPGIRTFIKDLGGFIDKAGTSLFNTRPSAAWITRNKQPLLGTQYTALESKDGKTTYLHVFLPPRGKSLKLPPPANGKAFHSAKLFDKGRKGHKVELVQDANGVTLTLKATEQWDFLDTIIILE